MNPTTRYLHLTTWDLSQAAFPVDCETPETSRYWLRQGDAVEQVSIEDLRKTQEGLLELRELAGPASQQLLATYLDGPLGEFVRRLWDGEDAATVANDMAAAKADSQRRKEVLFEAVRAQHYPHKPSRRGCIFVFPDASSAVVLGKQMSFDDNHGWVWIEPSPSARVHRGSISALNGNLHEQLWEAAAHRYWGDDEPAADDEMLIQGSFRIMGLATPTAVGSDPPGLGEIS